MRVTLMRVKLMLMATTLAAWPGHAQESVPSAPPAAESAKPEAQAPAGPPGAGTLPVSIPRVREKLKEKPPTISAPRPKADFSIQIEARRPLQEMFYVPPWATSPLAQAPICPPRGASYLPSSNCGAQAGFGFDPGSLIGSARRAFNRRVARDEVRRTIIEYCAAQPNGGAGIKICADEAR
jgi:hypothetical protein